MSKKRKRFVRIVCLILAILILGSVMIAGIARGASQWQINQLKDKKAEIIEKKNEISVHIATLRNEKASVLEQKEALDKQNELTREEIELINDQIELYGKLVSAKERRTDGRGCIPWLRKAEAVCLCRIACT